MDTRAYDRIIDLFLSGRMRGMSHARHVAIGNILRHREHGRELMHLGLRITAIRAGKRDKYSAEVTDRCWDALAGGLPALSEFADVLGAAEL